MSSYDRNKLKEAVEKGDFPIVQSILVEFPDKINDELGVREPSNRATFLDIAYHEKRNR